jgi:hypothetical protein
MCMCVLCVCACVCVCMYIGETPPSRSLEVRKAREDKWLAVWRQLLVEKFPLLKEHISNTIATQ